MTGARAMWQKHTMPDTTHDTTTLSAFLCGILFMLGFCLVWLAYVTDGRPFAALSRPTEQPHLVRVSPCQ